MTCLRKISIFNLKYFLFSYLLMFCLPGVSQSFTALQYIRRDFLGSEWSQWTPWEQINTQVTIQNNTLTMLFKKKQEYKSFDDSLFVPDEVTINCTAVCHGPQKQDYTLRLHMVDKTQYSLGIDGKNSRYIYQLQKNDTEH